MAAARGTATHRSLTLQLAAALRTTSATLLGAGQQAPPGRDLEEACWGSAGLVERLLGPRGIGRIAFGTASGLAVLPVNYAVKDGTIVIQTGSGPLIGVHGDGPFSFEADHFDLELSQGWSVLVRGEAHRVLQPGELRDLREDCDLRPCPAGEHALFVRIARSKLTGGRIRSQ